jgi:NDP-sugar pyrophosphorylase family protein
MNLEEIVAFFPVGGEAKRLKPLTEGTSKACVRLLNRPIIEFSLANLAEQGIKNFIFGVKGGVNYRNIFDYYREGVGFSAQYQIQPRVHIKYQPNLNDVGSADSLRLNLEYYNINAPILCAQGDNIFEIDLVDLIKEHEKREALMTIALSPVEKTEEYGIAKFNPSDMRIETFFEKPKTSEAPSKFANTGVYFFSPEIKKVLESKEINKIKETRNRLDFGMDLIPYLIDNDFPVYGYLMKKAWYDVGTPEGYLRAMHDILHGKLNIRVKEERIFPNRNIWIQGYSRESVERRNEIIKKCQEKRILIDGAALIGRHTKIEDGVEIKDSNIDNYCVIGKNTIIKDSAIMDSSTIGNSALIESSIIGRNVTINSSKDKPTIIKDVSVIGNDVKIGEGSYIIRTKIFPSIEIPPNAFYVNSVIQKNV